MSSAEWEGSQRRLNCPLDCHGSLLLGLVMQLVHDSKTLGCGVSVMISPDIWLHLPCGLAHLLIFPAYCRYFSPLTFSNYSVHSFYSASVSDVQQSG